ncbi:MAG: glycosyltransferase [Chthoniobacterales bacterium]|nr:glycosyltransferase [Chthoniobacterales bacterium]
MAPAGKARVSLAVPCFNERYRLDLRAFSEGAEAHDLQILFVDDGSADGTADFIAGEIAGDARLGLLRLPENRGKGAAVRAGMLHLAKKCPDVDWIGFWDADLSTPLDEVRRMLHFHHLEGGSYQAIWGSRVMRAGSRIERRFVRHLFGRLFATAAGEFLGVGAYDTQCGAKLFGREVVSDLFAEEFISRWIFDVELYCRMGHDRILEFPLKVWTHAPGSKVSVPGHSLGVAADLMKIRSKYGKRVP